MKKLGTLYGIDFLIDTDDEQLFKIVSNYFEKNFAPKMRTDAELEAEIDALISEK